MKTIFAILFTILSLSFFGQHFIGDISGSLYQNGQSTDFTWRFEGEQTIYILFVEVEGESKRVEITFNNESSAKIDTYEEGKLVNTTPFSIDELQSSIPVIVDKYESKGVALLGYETQKFQIRTKESEVGAWIGNLGVDWHGAQNFFREDVAFLVASEQQGNFPLKVIRTNLKGELQYSFEVKTIEKK